MNRFSTQPFGYASIDDLQRALLTQMRRFNRASSECAASNIIRMNAPFTKPKKPVSTNKKDTTELDRLQMMRDQVLLLKNMSGQIASQFSAEPRSKTIREQVDQLADEILQKSEELRRTLGKSASENINSNVKRSTNALMKELESDLGNRVDSIKPFYLIADIAPPGQSEAVIEAEIAYIRLENLKGAEGWSHPHYFVMTAYPAKYKEGAPEKLDKIVALDIFVAVSSEFKVPNKIRWESTAKNPKELRTMVDHMLKRDGIINASNKREIPIEGDKVSFAHKNIKSTTVKGDIIEVKVKNKNLLQQTMIELRSQLTGLVKSGDPKNRDFIVTKIEKDTGTIRFMFTLPNKLRGRLVSKDKLTEIKKILNLTPEELQRVRTALENPEQG